MLDGQLIHPGSILDAEFMRLAFASGAVVGVLAPAVGFFLVQRQMSLIGDGIGHIAFAGVALGYLIGVSPVATALVASVAGAVGIEQLRSRSRAAGDQALALFFYTGIAAGVVLISAANALNATLFTFLFGSILTVTRGDVVLVGVLGIAGLAIVAVLYQALVAVAIDEESARVSGIPVGTLNATLAGLAGVTVAVSMRIVGILLIAALMVLPVMTASRVATSLRSTLVTAIGIGVASVLVGLTFSYYFDLAPGGAIVLFAAGLFCLASIARIVRDRATRA
jgi:zinc transport system permease protein